MLLIAMLIAAPISDAQATPYDVDSIAWVPELGGAWTLAVGLEGRHRGIQSPGDSLWPTRGLRLDAGYLRYFTPHGTIAAGPTVAIARSLPDVLHTDLTYTHVSVGGVVRLRANDARFTTISAGLHVDGGPVFASQGLGWRAALSAEVLGVGLLWHLSPHLFGEIVPWLGVEVLKGERREMFLGGGLRLRIDFAHRRGDP
ncbi:MAG: hypothetical protein ACI9U2_001274 [Bradymonadia bacterium]|jgi:hypothetical protein